MFGQNPDTFVKGSIHHEADFYDIFRMLISEVAIAVYVQVWSKSTYWFRRKSADKADFNLRNYNSLEN